MESIVKLLKDGKERCFRALEEQGDLQRKFQLVPGVGALEMTGNSVSVESVVGSVYEFKLRDSGVLGAGNTAKLPLDEVFIAKLENSKVVFEKLSLSEDSKFALKVTKVICTGLGSRAENLGVVCEDGNSYAYASFISKEEKLTPLAPYDRYVHIIDGYVVNTEQNTL